MSESYIGGITFFFFALGAVLLIAYLPLLFSKNSGVSGKLLATAAISFISGFYFQYQNGLQFVDYEIALFFISCAIAMWVSNFAVYKYGAGIDLFVEDRGLGDFSSFLRKTIKATVFVVPFVLVVNILMQILFVSFKVDVDENGHSVRASLIEHLGTFGDFFGGTLTPILTFVSIVLLLMTIRQTQSANKLSGEMLDQAREQLDITAKEFELARIEHKRTANALHEQERTQRIQQFDSIFFSLYDRLMDDQATLEKIMEQKFNISLKGRSEDMQDFFRKIFQDEYKLDRYFISIYQLLRRVKEFNLYTPSFSDEMSDFEVAKETSACEKDNYFFQKSYCNILRSGLHNNTLFVLFANCSSHNSFSRRVGGYAVYREMLKKFNFFEHLDIVSEIEKKLSRIDESRNKNFNELINSINKTLDERGLDGSVVHSGNSSIDSDKKWIKEQFEDINRFRVLEKKFNIIKMIVLDYGRSAFGKSDYRKQFLDLLKYFNSPERSFSEQKFVDLQSRLNSANILP